jgi:hypothetical protein
MSLKVKILAFCLFGMMSLYARAATLIGWRNAEVANTSSNEVRMRIDGQKCLINTSPGMSLLLDGEAGQSYQILHPARVYVRQPLAELTASSPCANVTNPPVPWPTGRSQSISNLTALEYRITNACGAQVFWVVKEYPNFQQFREQSAQLSTNGISQLINQLGFPVISDQLPGMVVRSETVTTISFPGITNSPILAQTITNILNLISATIVADDPSLMKVPEGYEEVEELFSNPVAEEIKHAASRPLSQGSFVTDTNINMPDWSAAGVAAASSNRAVALKNMPPLQANQVRVMSWGQKGEETRIETLSPTNQLMKEFTSTARTNSTGPRFVRPVGALPPGMKSNIMSGLTISTTNSPVSPPKLMPDQAPMIDQ